MDKDQRVANAAAMEEVLGHLRMAFWKIAALCGDRQRAAAIYDAAIPRAWKQPPPKPPARSFAGEHLSWDGLEALEVCRSIAKANPTATPTAIARQATAVLQSRYRPPIYTTVAVTWRSEKTGTTTIRCRPEYLPELRHDIEAKCGPVLEWSIADEHQEDPNTHHNWEDPNDLDDGVLRQMKRLVKRHGLGQRPG